MKAPQGTLLALSLVLAACGSRPNTGAEAALAESDIAELAAGERCPLTAPPSPAFVPPNPWPAKPPFGRVSGGGQPAEVGWFWVGTPGLWTALPADGRWAQLALGEKFWFWSQEFDVQQEPEPGLRLTATRLDAAAPSVEIDNATNGYHTSFHWAMLAGVELPAPGCWQIEASYRGHQLRLVVDVPAS